jgi:rSAM/selenodomain-associated transferase 1
VVSTCLIVFAKNPIPNQVKTRLLPKLSADQAASLYRAFLTDWCETLAKLSNVDLVIAYTPPESQSDLQALIGNDVTYIPQTGADLGVRLTSATQWACDNGYKKILIVGSDSPTLPLTYISKGIVDLDSCDIVIGPSMDGGYYLIGFSSDNLNVVVPYIFEEIAWSTAHVLRQTVERIYTLNATFKLLPPWYDIDTPEDLSFLHAHLSAMRLAEDKVQAVRTEKMLLELLKENS